MAHGVSHTVVHAVRHGVNRGTTTIPGVTYDTGGGKYFPANASEWATFRTATGLTPPAPSSVWNFQEASGNFADTGGGGLTLTAAGTLGYRQAQAPYTRTATVFGATASDRAAMGVGVGPSPATTSSVWVWFSTLDATPAGTRIWAGVSNGAVSYQATLSNVPRVGTLINAVGTAGTLNPVAQGIQPLTVMYDRAGSRANVYTNAEKVTGTYSPAVVDGLKGVGANGGSGTSQRVVYGMMWQGAAAEALTDTDLKNIFTAMGFSISGY